MSRFLKRCWGVLERFMLTARMGPGCRARFMDEYEQKDNRKED